MQIKRTPDNDAICLETCKGCNEFHSMDCPYTQARWKQQGWSRIDSFTVATPKEVRESKAA